MTRLWLGALFALVTAGARADDALQVQVPALLDLEAPIAERVLAECAVESTVGNYVYSGVKRRFRDAKIRSQPGVGSELRLTILAARGIGPGPWTEKSIDLRAELLRDGKLIDTNVFHRGAGGSGFGRIRGTCEVFARLATVLGRDISNWLVTAMANPADARPLTPTAQPPAEPVPSAAAEKLEELQKLREDGLITRAEYEQKRAELLKEP